MRTQRWLWNSVRVLGIASAILVVPGLRAAQTAVPGTLNYVQGQVSLDGNTLTTQQNGHAEIQPNQVLSTGQGKAEILLSPGVFLRVGDNSQIRMISNDLVNPQVDIVHGEAMVEIDYLPKQASIMVSERGAGASLLKEGLYKFNAEEGQIQVIDGKARVNDNGQTQEIGKGKEIVLAGAPLKAVKFDRKAEDNLYLWSNVRAQYLAEANQATAQNVYAYGGWWGSGWYWNPWFGAYSWLPGDGFFWSPFGYPFFSPGFVRYAPTVRYYGGHGFAGRGFAGRGTLPAGAGYRGGFRPGYGGAHMNAAPRMGFARGGGGGGGRR